MPMHSFQTGQLYHRRNDIHSRYKGQQYGGIATPSNAPFIFLFSGESGEEYGYRDGFQPDGMYWYSGEGQVGDMQMTKGNAAIHTHAVKQKSLLVFEAVKKSYVRFLGEMSYIGHHKTESPDRLQNLRQAIVFHLELLPEIHAEPSSTHLAKEHISDYKTPRKKLEDLRIKALASAAENASLAERVVSVRQRSSAIKDYALTRANGRCEGCQNFAPFETKRGPFLEVHHVDRLADDGPDHPNRVIALCPNCHRAAHYAKNAQSFNQALKVRLTEIEPQ